MKLLLAAYAQRLLLTVFLTAFGAYLLIAMLTYTPYDPGWTHLSSDTLQVTNASGIAGAWIADLLYGFWGRASLLLPVMVLLEAVQLWWPHSLLSRPYRLAAQGFLLVVVAALCSIHVLEPADTLSNASGGIVGYELSRHLLVQLSVLPVTLFLLVLLFLMLTVAFGIRWSRTFEVMGQLPFLLRELFYRNQHTSLDQVSPVQAFDASVLSPVAPVMLPNDAPISRLPTDAPAVSESSRATPLMDLPDSAVSLESNLVWSEPVVTAPIEHTEAGPTVRIAPRFDWDDQAVFHDLLEAVPTAPPVAPAVSSPDPFDHALLMFDDALAQPATPTAEALPTPDAAAVFVAQTEVDPVAAWLADVAVESAADTTPQSLIANQPPTAADESPSHQLHGSDPEDPDLSWLTDDETETETETFTATPTDAHPEVAQPETQPEMQPETQLIRPVVHAVVNEADTIRSEAGNTAQALDDNVKASDATWVDETINSPAASNDGLRINPLTPDQLAAELDAPLTDAHGRTIAPLSRAMQVAERRAGLSLLPSMDLLDAPDPDRKPSYTAEELERLSELLEIKLQEFNIKGRVIEAQPGPVVTRFEVDLAAGVKASKVTNISRDLARSMSMASVRVVEVIAGKPYIGIEVPNKTREMVRLSELLHTAAYRDPTALISVAMGKDIAGRPVLADLAKAPHMLVAGTTGSGKSVAVNAMLLSMLLKYPPAQLRLILIDPKQLELANYGDIPHLLTPVVTDMKDAVSALNWSVGEMERRYKLMTLFKVRKIDEFNRKVIEANERGEDLLDPLWKPEDSAVQDKAPRLKPLPLIVIVADEFADMIMQIGKKAEELITRLAQKSRAAGIHLMLATQRPSVDVITGLIKANIPTRVALRVNSKIDSRTILDAAGAEDMLGHGDMLFLAPGKNAPERVHGAFISDDEVNRICDAWRERGSPDYVDDILNGFDEDAGSKGGGYDGDSSGDSERDPMYDQVVAFVLETRKVSASSIQRKFSLGYNRAARIVDALEAAGIVSGMGSSGKRELLV
jgi:S-DNA-T family DNA segregation ATPase FtsK/SpoIIIE